MTCFKNICTLVLSVAVMLLSALIVSCTKVEFTGDPIKSFDDIQSVEINSTTKIDFEIEWPSDIEEDNIPEYITVVMNRIQNSRAHYVYHLDSNGDVIVSEEIPEEENPEVEEETPEVKDGAEVEENPETEDDSEVEDDYEEGMSEGVPTVQNGFYSIAAVAVNDQKDFDLPVVEQFADSLDYSMRDVYVTIPKLTREEKIEQNYIDYNPVYPYIRTVKPFYYVRPSIKTHTEIWTNRGEDIKTIHLRPQPLTRKVSFNIGMEVEEGVVIERIVGMISGVPSKVQLMTGYVEDKQTSKVPFDMKPDGENRYSGEINVFGLFPPAKDSLYVGPGILTVTIHASAEHEGVTYKNIFYYNINMKRAIEEAEIMILTEDRSAYRFSDTENTDANGNYIEIKEFELNADDGLIRKIKKDDVITGKGQGFNKWVPIEGNDDDKTNPGLHPEV